MPNPIVYSIHKPRHVAIIAVTATKPSFEYLMPCAAPVKAGAVKAGVPAVCVPPIPDIMIVPKPLVLLPITTFVADVPRETGVPPIVMGVPPGIRVCPETIY
jgi:hypothetical protein